MKRKSRAKSSPTKSNRSSLPAIAAAIIMAALFVPSCGKKAAERSVAEKFEIEKKYERGPVAVNLKLSKKEITIAERITLLIEARMSEDYELQLPKFGDKLEQFGIVDYHAEPPKLLAGGVVLAQKSYVLEPFLSGDYTIPPMKIYFWKKGAASKDKHEIETEQLTVKVNSILPEKYADLKIKEIAGPVELPSGPGVWLYLVGAVALILISGAVFFILRLRRRKVEEAAKVPAHELAYDELEKLLAEGLIEKGHIKLFYFRISDILRHYIDNRFGLRAPERTTEEFLEELSSNSPFEHEHDKLLKEFLKHCDLVKFAEYQPTNDDIQRTFDVCKEFIASTQTEEAAKEVALA